MGNTAKKIEPHQAVADDARERAAAKVLFDALRLLVREEIRVAQVTEYVDQDSSPLGHRRHLRAVQKGLLKAVSIGKRRVVPRTEVEQYMRDEAERTHARKHPARVEAPALLPVPAPEPSAEEIAADRMLAKIGIRKRK